MERIESGPRSGHGGILVRVRFFGGPSSLSQKFAGITTLFVKRTTWVLNGHLRRGKKNVFDTGHRGTGWSDPRGSFSGGPAGPPTGGTVSTADDNPADTMRPPASGRRERRAAYAGWRARTGKLKEIQTWAVAYHSATGRWPTAQSGPIALAPALGETWMAIDLALRFGHRGLPGGQSLARVRRPARHRRQRKSFCSLMTLRSSPSPGPGCRASQRRAGNRTRRRQR
jgi:hypothetical protein